MAHRPCTSFRTVFATFLLLFAIAIRVVVPQGYMWAIGADGSPEMVSCSGVVASQTLSPLAAAALAAQHRSDERDHPGKTAEHPCAFAATSATVDLATVLHPVPPMLATTDAPVPLRPFVQPGRGLAAPPPPKTGPPALA